MRDKDRRRCSPFDTPAPSKRPSSRTLVVQTFSKTSVREYVFVQLQSENFSTPTAYMPV